MNKHTEESKLIDSLGGNSVVRKLCGQKICSQAISRWRKYGIPDSWLMYLKQVEPDKVKYFEDQKKLISPS